MQLSHLDTRHTACYSSISYCHAAVQLSCSYNSLAQTRVKLSFAFSFSTTQWRQPAVHILPNTATTNCCSSRGGRCILTLRAIQIRHGGSGVWAGRVAKTAWTWVQNYGSFGRPVNIHRQLSTLCLRLTTGSGCPFVNTC